MSHCPGWLTDILVLCSFFQTIGLFVPLNEQRHFPFGLIYKYIKNTIEIKRILSQLF